MTIFGGRRLPTAPIGIAIAGLVLAASTTGISAAHSAPAERPVTQPAAPVVYRWFQLADLGTSGGDAWGFAHAGWLGLAGDWYGTEGFTSTVAGVGTEDWMTFALDGQCTKFSAGVGGTGGDGQARVSIEVDGVAKYARDFGDDQVEGVTLGVTGAKTVRVSAVSLTEDEADTGVGTPRIYCKSTFTRQPSDTKKRHWVDLVDKGTSGGDADGFAAAGWIGLAGRWYGTEGFAGSVSESDIEDWMSVKVPSKCTRFTAGIGGAGGYGTAVVQVSLGGRMVQEREFSDDQVGGVVLNVAGAGSIRIVATSTSEDDVTIAVAEPRMYCAR